MVVVEARVGAKPSEDNDKGCVQLDLEVLRKRIREGRGKGGKKCSQGREGFKSGREREKRGV